MTADQPKFRRIRAAVSRDVICAGWAVAAVLVALVGCSGSSGEPLWRKACKHGISLEAEGVRAGLKVDDCVANFAELPRGEADSVARCVLAKKSLRELDSCSGPTVERRYQEEKQTAVTRAKLADVQMRAERHYMEMGRYPTAEELGSPQDAWDQPLRVSAEAGTFAVCSSGPDRAADTGDDLCTE